MSRPRFLADQDFNDDILTGISIQEPLVEIVRCREVGLDRAPDAQILEYADEYGLIVLSHDVNTMSAAAYDILSRGQSMRGLMFAVQNPSLGPVIENLILIWAASEAEEWQNRVIFLPW